MGMNEMIVNTFKSLGGTTTLEEQRELLHEVRKYNNLPSWRGHNSRKVGGLGLVTGVVGGPIGIALEGVDLGLLLRTCARASYGIGHIINRREVDYVTDIDLILAVWANAAIATSGIAAGKAGIMLSAKGATVVTPQFSTKMAVKAASKLSAKTAGKLGPKFGAKVATLAAPHLGTKIAAKAALKWIPIVGGVTSAGINLWLINGFMDAAEKFYRCDYLEITSKELAAAL